jgi:hypothetical protein
MGSPQVTHIALFFPLTHSGWIFFPSLFSRYLALIGFEQIEHIGGEEGLSAFCVGFTISGEVGGLIISVAVAINPGLPGGVDGKRFAGTGD